MDEATGMFEVIKVSTIHTELWQSLCMYVIIMFHNLSLMDHDGKGPDRQLCAVLLNTVILRLKSSNRSGKYFLSWSSHLETCYDYEVSSQPAEALHPVPVHSTL